MPPGFDVLELSLVTATSAGSGEQLLVTVRICTTVACDPWSIFAVSVSFENRELDTTIDWGEEAMAATDDFAVEIPSDENASDVYMVVETPEAAGDMQVVDVSVAESWPQSTQTSPMVSDPDSGTDTDHLKRMFQHLMVLIR
jgi:hypothetical protein